MRRRTYILLALLVLALLYRERGQVAPALQSEPPLTQNAPPAERVSVRSEPARIPSPRKALAPQKTTAASAVHAIPLPESGPGSAPDPRWVQFEVKNGLAIAFGDVILGKVEDAYAKKTGYYEPNTPQIWDNATVPYSIAADLKNPKRVEDAVRYFNEHTPVRFTPYQGEADAIVFETGDDNCLSAVGKIGGIQPISLADGCHTQEIIHEMLHALGFIHEQMRPDRDAAIEILWDNIDEKYRPQFALAPDTLFGPMRDTPFDFQSIMLYRTSAFAISASAPTMRSKTGTPIAPVTNGLSAEDVHRLYRLYRLEEPRS